MPNHVTNYLTIVGTDEEIKSVYEKYFTHYPEKPKTDYQDRIILVKEDSNKEIGWFDEKTNTTYFRDKEPIKGKPLGYIVDMEESWNHFPDFNKVIPQPDNIFNGNLNREEEEKCKKEGRPTWNNWNRENWGTKWNSYSCEKINDNKYKFETAWSCAYLIVKKMSQDFPNIEFILEFSDEDMGYNCGVLKYKNDVLIEEKIPKGGTNEAYELAIKLHPEYENILVNVNGIYTWIEQ